MLTGGRRLRIENRMLLYAVYNALLQRRKAGHVKFSIKLEYENRFTVWAVSGSSTEKGKMSLGATAR